MATLTLAQEDYEALLSFAQRGTRDANWQVSQQQAVQLDALLQKIEQANGITRYSLWCQFQNPTAPLPPGTNFPKTWPPNLRSFIQFLTRPITKADVMQVVTQQCPNAVNILVTPDPGALLGWTALDDYFPT